MKASIIHAVGIGLLSCGLLWQWRDLPKTNSKNPELFEKLNFGGDTVLVRDSQPQVATEFWQDTDGVTWIRSLPMGRPFLCVIGPLSECSEAYLQESVACIKEMEQCGLLCDTVGNIDIARLCP